MHNFDYGSLPCHLLYGIDGPCVKFSMHVVQHHHCKVQGSKLITLKSTLHDANTMQLQLNLLIDLQNLDS
jgi:hypothetical protein